MKSPPCKTPSQRRRCYRTICKNGLYARGPTAPRWARRFNVDTADEEVAKAKAGHWPTLDLVLGYTAADSETLSTQNQRNRYSSAGVELNIPLYSGGYVSARARQSVATRDQAE